MLATQRTNLLRWGMVGLLIAAFAIRALTLTNQSLWRDEVDALRFAQAPWREMLATFTRPGWNGPLYFVLLRGWVKLGQVLRCVISHSSLACSPLRWLSCSASD
jgi:hypothetical protein